MGKYLWIREVQIGGHRADLAMGGTPDKRVLLLYYPSVGVKFIAEIRSDGDIAEFVAILSTYVPRDK